MCSETIQISELRRLPQFIVMLFPTPLSSRVLVRKTLAAVIAESGNIIGGEIEAFLAEEERVRNGIYDQAPELGKDRLSMKERRVRRISGRVMAVSVCRKLPSR